MTTAAPRLPSDRVAARSPRDRGDHLGISTLARRADATQVTVTLHVLDGSIGELEFFDPLLGEGHAIDPDSVTTPGAPDVY